MVSIRLHILGSFVVERSHQLVRLPTRKVESFLAYLVLHPVPHAREKLAALFWGGTSDEQARHSLRTALHALRKYLDADLLWAEKTTIQVNPHYPLWVDAREFERITGGVASNAELPQSAVELYRGDLLADCYDDWVLAKRERYRELYLEAVLHTTQQLRSQSEYARAIGFAQKALALDPANERAHQHLMFCYLALGKRDAAIQQYQTLKRTLLAELAFEPSPESTALYHWIQEAPTAGPASAANITNLPIPLSSFIGRQYEMAHLKALLRQTRLVTLAGVGGSGKTRLAIQIATDLIDTFKDGVWWIELAALADESLVPDVVAKGPRLQLQTSPADPCFTTISNSPSDIRP